MLSDMFAYNSVVLLNVFNYLKSSKLYEHLRCVAEGITWTISKLDGFFTQNNGWSTKIVERS